MNKEEFIESILTEWSGKTISSNEHFMWELRMILEAAIGYGRRLEKAGE